jgi:hypothetical protein
MRWTLAFGYHEDRTPTHGYEATKPVILPPGRATLATRPSATGAARRLVHAAKAIRVGE